MPYCAECRMEYRDGFTVCADCGAPLVEVLPPPPDPGEGYVYDGEPVLLCPAADGLEAGMLMATLEEQGIPALQRPRGAGQMFRFTFGASCQGVDILVPPLLLDRAREIADAVRGTAETGNDEDAHTGTEDEDGFEQEVEQEAKARRRQGQLLFATLFGLPFIVVLLPLLLAALVLLLALVFGLLPG